MAKSKSVLFRRPDPTVPRHRPAAGILCRHTDRYDGSVWWLLGQRAPRRLGGTWANIGGSLESGETPLVGAAREFHEELGIPVANLAGARIATVLECGTPERPYTLFVLDVPVCFDDAVLGWENDDVAWWRTPDVATLDLHPKFALAWATLNR
jgi:8-oxo-dGTP pyrophosphatase MutT (NUDIX family)